MHFSVLLIVCHRALSSDDVGIIRGVEQSSAPRQGRTAGAWRGTHSHIDRHRRRCRSRRSGCSRRRSCYSWGRCCARGCSCHWTSCSHREWGQRRRGWTGRALGPVQARDGCTANTLPCAHFVCIVAISEGALWCQMLFCHPSSSTCGTWQQGRQGWTGRMFCLVWIRDGCSDSHEHRIT